ncbi:MAG TPA: ABC transporter substrate-binding protein, partial [Rhizobiaceae bacterium]|nr:ABC transporter substrate-binding protein [Rhizobiaceae bacterium]
KRNLFYDAYERSQTLFERSVYKAEGKPSPEELALLEPLRADLPEEVFGKAVMQPVSNGSGRDRKLLGEATRLLAEAGWTRDGTLLHNDKGETLEVEFLVQDEVHVRIDTPFLENMRAIGIDASIRMVDSAQYQARLDNFDFDIIGVAYSLSATPTRDEVERFFHSRSAAINGTNNFPGSASPALDALVDAVGAAKDRDSFNIAMRALDRALRARHDWLPNWYSATHRAAFWDMFGYKELKPDFGFPVEAMWWFDEEKAKAIGKA